MKLISIIILSAFVHSVVNNDSKDVIKKMYDRYGGKWFSTFTFVQTTENYRNDSLIKTSTWYEAVMYPDNFRIDFGDIKDGNAVIFKKDSAYSFHDGSLKKVSSNTDNLTFLLGGMYFFPYDSIISKLTKSGYNLNHFYEDKIDEKPVYVIGADNKEDKSNQIWIDKEKLLVVKFIKFEDGHKEEGIFEDHKQFGNGWSETKCRFYVDDKLLQKETYHDCKAGGYLDPKVFEPSLFGKIHWYHP